MTPHSLQFVSDSPEATRRWGCWLGKSLPDAWVIALQGTLGAGKTCLTQGLAEGLDVPPDQVTSPTFTLCVPHQGRVPLVHLDAYRIRHAEEVDELGLDEWVEQGAVLVIEWPERIEGLPPPIDWQIQLDATGPDQRTLQLRAVSDRGKQHLKQLDESGPHSA